MSEKYSLVKQLGEGSFGKCYLVESSQDRQYWVIKQIDIRSMSSSEKDEAVREALILKSLSHPNIIRFKDAYKTKKEKLCIVMEYADHGDLQGAIEARNGKYFSESQVIDWFVQICLALKHCHDRKILHRDLKSQNIFLTKNGRAKLGDFGIAKVLKKTCDNARSIVGTPYYLSPEIVNNTPYSFQSDIWSLGVLLYEMCCLKPPFDSSSLHFLALKIVRGVFPPLPSHYSRELKVLVSRMLSTDPRRRPRINQILREPFIRNRIHDFLSASIKANEFSHTILHNQNPFEVAPPPEILVSSPPQKYKEVNENKYGSLLMKNQNPPEVPQVAWTEDEQKDQVLAELRERKDEAARASIEVWGSARECMEEEAMLYEMGEAMIIENFQDDELTQPLSPKELEEEAYDEATLQRPSESNYSKIEALRFYLEERIGTDVLVEAYKVLQEFEDEEEIGYDKFYVHLDHLMTRELQLEYLPLIQTLIEMEKF